ncbi:hypothetical protein SRABI27_01414 [Pedobacter sp. Bi27]|uniref:hypothetical protein n=1 Tax=unclassified Pedobacter TaxID=2628915 RepID=UPI001D501EA8|nr:MULTISPECIES: hypothetical protein [unclassified Pedobacter]CAH0163462.1 hypothetical protein SRABI36_01075 [Pedobacter sp. Bi36]CAH0187594.1 hypothetical protein SRABI27_01414 [Pedobacter sp. Bi27]CAH0219223.1 hypothetical protein SRABI126_02166 [Pedobacter sp. Bi126]
MNEEINELLSIYEQEKELIESIIEEDRIDSDYKAIYINSKNLNRIQRQIALIKSLIDPYAQEKERLKRKIDFFVKKSELEESDEYRTQMLAQIDRKLDQLNSYKPGYFNDGQEFDDAIFDLVEQKIKGFIFNLKKENKLAILFKRTDKEILLAVTNIKKLKKQHILDKNAKAVLKSIGFKEEKHVDSLVFTYGLDNFKDAIFIKTIVSRVIFDAFYFQGLDTKATIEIF